MNRRGSTVNARESFPNGGEIEKDIVKIDAMSCATCFAVAKHSARDENVFIFIGCCYHFTGKYFDELLSANHIIFIDKRSPN